MILAVETDPIPHYITVSIPGFEIIENSIGGLVLQSVLFDIIVPKLILTIPVSKFWIILIALIHKN